MRLSMQLASLALLASITLSVAEEARGPIQGPEAPEPPPTFVLDKKGKRQLIDFTLPVKPVSEMLMKFSQLANRKLMVFYFSAKCPHCQHAAPVVQKLADEMRPKGYETVGIAIKFNTDEDIRAFIRDYSIRIPIFQDEQRIFGETYGTGSIPILLLINEKGEYIRYKTFDTSITPSQVRSEISNQSKK